MTRLKEAVRNLWYHVAEGTSGRRGLNHPVHGERVLEMESESASIDLIRWAARQLGVEPGAPVADIRAAFRNRLREVDYLPSIRLQLAFRVLTDKSP